MAKSQTIGIGRLNVRFHNAQSPAVDDRTGPEWRSTSRRIKRPVNRNVFSRRLVSDGLSDDVNPASVPSRHVCFIAPPTLVQNSWTYLLERLVRKAVAIVPRGFDFSFPIRASHSARTHTGSPSTATETSVTRAPDFGLSSVARDAFRLRKPPSGFWSRRGSRVYNASVDVSPAVSAALR